MAAVRLKSEVAGLVWQINKQLGEDIAAGDIVMTIECMKMEIPLVAVEKCTLKEIKVKEGELVAEGQTVAVLETAFSS